LENIHPLVKLEVPLQSMATMSFCDGFEVNPKLTEGPIFIKACLEALGMEDSPEGYTKLPVKLDQCYAIVSKEQVIVGIVFPQDGFFVTNT